MDPLIEQRRYPRIHLPLLVELKHPSLGVRRCVAKDISEGGVFVYTDNPQIALGAKVKLTLQNTLSVETQPTPTVEMTVARVQDDGLALSFVNITGRHLWDSVERLRTELAIGRDYFQIHLNLLVINPDNAILLVQQHGRWGFPATFLTVGEDWKRAAGEYLARETGTTLTDIGSILTMHSAGTPEVPEAAVMDLFVEARGKAGTSDGRPSNSRYRALRWTNRRRDIEESTFASEAIRTLAGNALKRLIKEEKATKKDAAVKEDGANPAPEEN